MKLSASLFAVLLVIQVAFAQKREMIIRQGHKAAINMVKYSPTGKYVYSASDDKSIKMWDVATGIDVETFNAHEAPVLTIELSADGQSMVSGDADGTLILWNALSGEVLTKIAAHDGPANTAKLSKDGQTIVSGGEDQILKIWTLQGDTIKTIKGFKAPIKNLAISPSGDRIVTGGGKNNGVEVKLVDPEKGKILSDALDNVKGSGAALAYTKVVMTGFAVIGNVANGRVKKGMTTIFVMSYSNIEFTDDGNKVLFSQNIYVPFLAEKGEEEDTGSASASIVELAPDRNTFGEVKRANRWQIPHSRGIALFNQDQTKVIVNEERSIKVYDIANAEFPEAGSKEATQYVPPVVKEIKNITRNTNWLALSPDYRTVITSDNNRQLKLWDYESGRKIRDMQGYVQPALAVDVLPDGKHILVGSLDRNMTMWDITTGKLVRVFDRSSDVNHIDISKDGRYIATTAVDTKFAKIWNLGSGRLVKSLMDKQTMTWVKFDDADENIVYAMTDDGTVKEWSISDIKSKKSKAQRDELEDKFQRGDHSVSFDGYDVSISRSRNEVIADTQGGVISDAVISCDGRFAITTNESGEIALYSLEKEEKTASMTLVGENGYITYTPEYYYTSSKSAAQAIAFKEGNNVLPFEQLELTYNRPDIVAKALGYASDKLVASYEAAYKKRLQRLGYSVEDLTSSAELPTVSVNALDLPLETDQSMLSFTVDAEDARQSINRLRIYVNDVPVYGSKGLEIAPATKVSKDVTIELSAGLNEIKVTALNQQGAESIPQTFEIQYTADYDKPDLYIVAIGVSKYQEPEYNLAFAAKDASDILTTLKASTAYEKVNEKLLTNEEATDTNVLAIKDFVAQAGVDDVVMIFVAGHGVLDKDYNYYFATNNMDFGNPANGGLSYEALQSLLDGIKCRNKILMMDTCHSGELDKDDVEEANKEVKSVGSVAFRSTGNLVKLKENSFGLENTLELSKALFSDMKKGTGATIVSAAGGTEFAAEGVNSQNGLFTNCLIQGITSRRADLNRDRTYTVSELRAYVGEEVIRISDGRQVPTSREENIKNDFRVY